MTPYQRGCRDALLDLAARLDAQVNLYNAEMMSVLSGRGYNDRNPVHYGTYARLLGQATALRDARNLARALAERLPDDPESA